MLDRYGKMTVARSVWRDGVAEESAQNSSKHLQVSLATCSVWFCTSRYVACAYDVARFMCAGICAWLCAFFACNCVCDIVCLSTCMCVPALVRACGGLVCACVSTSMHAHAYRQTDGLMCVSMYVCLCECMMFTFIKLLCVEGVIPANLAWW